MYPYFGHIYSEMGKENKLACRNFIIYLQRKNKKKRMKRDENEALHLIMMMKTIYKYLQKKILT